MKHRHVGLLNYKCVQIIWWDKSIIKNSVSKVSKAWYPCLWSVVTIPFRNASETRHYRIHYCSYGHTWYLLSFCSSAYHLIIIISFMFKQVHHSFIRLSLGRDCLQTFRPRDPVCFSTYMGNASLRTKPNIFTVGSDEIENFASPHSGYNPDIEFIFAVMDTSK